MTKVYKTGAYDFKRHHVAEYLVEAPNHVGYKPVESEPGSTRPSSITMSEIQQDRLTKITDGKLVQIQWFYRTQEVIRRGVGEGNLRNGVAGEGVSEEDSLVTEGDDYGGQSLAGLSYLGI